MSKFYPNRWFRVYYLLHAQSYLKYILSLLLLALLLFWHYTLVSSSAPTIDAVESGTVEGPVSTELELEDLNIAEDTTIPIYTARYEIDRSDVPSITYYDLTLKVKVNNVSSVEVIVDSEPVSHTYDSESGYVTFTTSGTEIEVITDGATDLREFGTISKAALLHDKGFAWSHGMDDNVELKDQVDLLESYGWRGTFYLIGSSISDTRNEPWVADTEYLKDKLAAGWALGSHTWEHNCTPIINPQFIIMGDERLQEIIDASSRPDYRLISFAAPCFVPEYHPIILGFRDAGTTSVQFNESGPLTPFWIDEGATEDILNEETLIPDAYAFDYDLPVGRSTNMSSNAAPLDIETIDWIAARHNETGEHFWFNTLTHGDDNSADDIGDEAQLRQFAAHLYTNYGPGGSDQVWVAPSDEIYSYLLVRDRSVIDELGVFDVSGGTVAIPMPELPDVDPPESLQVFLPLAIHQNFVQYDVQGSSLVKP